MHCNNLASATLYRSHSLYDHDEEEGIRKLQALLGELDTMGPSKSAGAGGIEPLIQSTDVLAFLFEHLAKVERWKQVLLCARREPLEH